MDSLRQNDYGNAHYKYAKNMNIYFLIRNSFGSSPLLSRLRPDTGTGVFAVHCSLCSNARPQGCEDASRCR